MSAKRCDRRLRLRNHSDSEAVTNVAAKAKQKYTREGGGGEDLSSCGWMGDNVPLGDGRWVCAGRGCGAQKLQTSDAETFLVHTVRLAILVGWEGAREAEAGEQALHFESWCLRCQLWEWGSTLSMTNHAGEGRFEYEQGISPLP